MLGRRVMVIFCCGVVMFGRGVAIFCCGVVMFCHGMAIFGPGVAGCLLS